jgi:hypothetical protein
MVAGTSWAKGQFMKTFDLQSVYLGVGKTTGKRNVSPGNGDCQPPMVEKVAEQTRKPRGTSVAIMDSIACGVEAWLDESTSYSRRVTETTVDIARKLGVPEGEIERWANRRLTCSTEKGKAIKSLLERLQASSPAH